MSRKRMFELLAQLEANQQRQVEVDAAIFTVAQVAVNELQGRVERHLKQLEAGD